MCGFDLPLTVRSGNTRLKCEQNWCHRRCRRGLGSRRDDVSRPTSSVEMRPDLQYPSPPSIGIRAKEETCQIDQGTAN